MEIVFICLTMIVNVLVLVGYCEQWRTSSSLSFRSLGADDHFFLIGAAIAAVVTGTVVMEAVAAGSTFAY